MTDTKIDPATVEIVRNRLGKIAEEMQSRVMNSAYSSMWQEAGDLSCGILSRDAEIVGQADRAIPIHIATMTTSARGVIEDTGGYEALQPGDVLIQNDPYSGNNHLPDFILAQPVFLDDTLLGFAAVRAHWLDVGGSSPTSYATDTGHIIKEGLRIPPSKLFHAGERNCTLENVILSNVRGRREREGDYNAQLAGVRYGQERFEALAEQYGPEIILECIDTILTNEETRMKNRIDELSDGSYTATDYLDGDSIDAKDIEINVKVTIEGDTIHVDFADTDKQVPGGVNAPLAVTLAATHYAVKTTLDPGEPGTSGAYRPISVEAPEGSLLNPRHPAPVVAGNHETANRAYDTVVRAIATIDSELGFGAGEGSTNGITYQSLESGTINRTRMVGGMGACPRRDGVNAIRSGVGNTGFEPVERFEDKYKFVIIDELSIVPDTGGAGQYRGGNAGRMVTRFTDKTEVILTSDRCRIPPYGINGGREGSCGKQIHISPDGEETALPPKVTTTVPAGSQILLQPAGGGGYGSPADRSRNAVLADVRDGYISAETAKEEYNVDASLTDK